MTTYYANDKYSAKLRSTWVSDPAATTLEVDAIPGNVPTIVVVGWGTDYETVFTVTNVSGDSASNYTLTGVARLKGYNGNLASGLAVNCLNNEEFFNQYSSQIADIQAVADAAAIAAITVNSISSSANITPVVTTDKNFYLVTALAAAANINEPDGSPTQGQVLILRIKDNGTARALTWDTDVYRGIGVDLPETTNISKTLYIGFIYNATDNYYDCVAVQEES